MEQKVHTFFLFAFFLIFYFSIFNRWEFLPFTAPAAETDPAVRLVYTFFAPRQTKGKALPRLSLPQRNVQCQHHGKTKGERNGPQIRMMPSGHLRYQFLDNDIDHSPGRKAQ